MPEEDTLTQKQRSLINEKVLGYQKGYLKLEEQDEHINEKGSSRPNIVIPLDFVNTKVCDLFNNDCEHYVMSQKMQK